jgi:hypothetical protein
MIKKFLNWIKNIFKPARQNEVEQKGFPIINETAKQKKIRLKHKGASE